MGCINSKTTSNKYKATTTNPKQNGDLEGPKSNIADTSPTDTRSKKQSLKRSATDDTPAESSVLNGTKDASAIGRSFLLSVLEATEKYLACLPDSATVKQAVALTFMNSCVEVVRSKLRLKTGVIMELVHCLTSELGLPLLQSTLPLIEERTMDDSFSRLLLAWVANNPDYSAKISAESGQAAVDSLFILTTLDTPVTFKDLLAIHFQWASANEAALRVFTNFSDGEELMTAEQFGIFLRETQRIEVTDRQLSDKFKYGYGGSIHRYNFASYNGSVLTNSAIDRSRTNDVWQDMTQSLTHYCICCARIEEVGDMKRALMEGVRALVLNLHKGADGSFYSGNCPFQVVVEGMKKAAFMISTYPVVLCLSPESPLTVPQQDEVARIITESLGPMLAKGLMFEGAAISDPKFSPGALRKKVLVMSHQSPLKPFIGFAVADMNKDGLGVRVTDVVENTPAAKSGVAKDDWLTHMDGKPIRNKQHLREALAKLKVGVEFTVKRENLDEIKIVVGGVVDTNDRTCSRALSNITFLRYSDQHNLKPWDTLRLDVKDLLSSSLKRKDFTDTFALVRINEGHKTENGVDYEYIASQLGIHFVDVDNSDACLAWSRGRFSDNGRCGYLLKTDINTQTPVDIIVNVIAGPRAIGAGPLISASVVLHGAGSVRHGDTQLAFSGCDDLTIAVVNMTFEERGCQRKREFTASFSPLMLRPGYRVLPIIAAGTERNASKQIHGVYCFVRRH